MSNLKLIVASLLSLDISTAALLPPIIGILLAAELNPTEQEALGNFIVEIGDTLNTVAFLTEAKKAKEEEEAPDNKNDKKNDENASLQEQQEKMQKQIDELQTQNQEMQKTMQELLKELKRIHDECIAY